MLPEPLDRLRRRAIREASECIRESGFVCCESGEQHGDKLRLCCHTDRGPANQEKERNEDDVLTWISPDGALDRPCWAVAMADGVSSSSFAREAAELVCWIALSDLIASAGKASLAVGQRAVLCAARSLQKLGNVLQADPQRFMPYGDYASTWAYVLRKGRFLQTTLTLAWECDNELFVVVVGDGGAVIRNGDLEASEWITPMTKDSNLVHALGPDNLSGQQLDTAYHIEAPGTFRLALFTDGVQPAIREKPEQLFDETLASVHVANSAKAILREWVRSDPAQFDDNLTLTLVTRDDHRDSCQR